MYIKIPIRKWGGQEVCISSLVGQIHSFFFYSLFLEQNHYYLQLFLQKLVQKVDNEMVADQEGAVHSLQ